MMLYFVSLFYLSIVVKSFSFIGSRSFSTHHASIFSNTKSRLLTSPQPSSTTSTEILSSIVNKLDSSSPAVNSLVNRINNFENYKLSPQDIELLASCFWGIKSADYSFKVLHYAVNNNVYVTRAAMYDVFKSFCHENRYDLMDTALELFPDNGTSDPFKPSERLKWRCRILTENNLASEALALVKETPAEIDVSVALSTIIQTSTKLEQHQASLTAYTMLTRSNGAANLNGYDYRAVFKSAKILCQHKVALEVFQSWVTWCLKVSTSSRPDKTNSAPVVNTMIINQATVSAISIGDFELASKILFTIMPDLNIKPDKMTGSLKVRIDIEHQSDSTKSPPSSSSSTSITSALNEESDSNPHSIRIRLLALLENSFSQGNGIDDRSVTKILSSLSKVRDVEGVEMVVEKLRNAGFKLNNFHYSVMARLYGSIRRPKDAMQCLEMAIAGESVPDIALYNTVLDAIAQHAPSRKQVERIARGAVVDGYSDPFYEDEEESHDNLSNNATEDTTTTLTTMTTSIEDTGAQCNYVLQDALSRLAINKESLMLPPDDLTTLESNRQRITITKLRERVLTLFNTAMKPYGRQGNVEGLEALYANLTGLGLAPDNITLATRLRAYSESGRYSTCESELLLAIQQGKYPNGGVLSVAISALVNCGRYSDGWKLFMHHGQTMGYLRKVALSADTPSTTSSLTSSSSSSTSAMDANLSFEFTDRGGDWGKTDSSQLISSSPTRQKNYQQSAIRRKSNGLFTSDDNMLVKDAVLAAMTCCAKGQLQKEALSLIKAITLSGRIDDIKLFQLAESACSGSRSRELIQQLSSKLLVNR